MFKQGNVKKVIVIAIFASVIIAGCATGTDQKVNPYPFNTAKIEYELSGNIEGTQTVYIKGDLTARETQGVKNTEKGEKETHDLYLEIGDSRYEIDLNTKEGIKTMNPLYNELRNLKQNEKNDFLLKIATGAAETEGLPTSTGQEKFAGKTCNMYDISDIGEICIWNSIPLYYKRNQNVTTAVSVETDIDIDDAVFAVPADVTITDSASL